MTKSNTKKHQTGSSASALSSAMMAVSPKAMEAWIDIMNESAGFVADRLQKDQEIQKALLACKTPAELLRIQSEFFKEAVEQYSAQTTRMLEKMTKAAETTLKETTSGRSRGYDDVPL